MDFDRKQMHQLQANSPSLSRQDLLIIILLLLTVVVAKWPILDVPYHWDEMGAYFDPSWWLSKRSLLDVLPQRHPTELFFGHPPLLYLMAAVLFKLFGAAPPVAHALAIFFASVGIMFTYLLGRLLVSTRAGLGGAILLGSFPLYFAQAGMLLGDIPITAVGIMAVYYRVAGKPLVYALCTTVMVLLKETSILLVLVLLLFEAVQEYRGERRWQLLLPHAVPLLVLTVFFVMQKISCGSFLLNPYFHKEALVVLAPGKLLWKGAFACYWALFAQWRFLLTGTIIAACWRFKRQLPAFFILFALIVSVHVFAYTGIYFLPRYMLMAAPYVCLAAAASLHLLLADSRLFYLGIALPVVLAVAVPPYKKSGYDSFETNMQYLDVIKTNKEAAAALEKEQGGKTVLTHWPLTAVFAEPRYGYIKNPLPITQDGNASWDLVAVTPQGDQAVGNSLRQLIAAQQLIILNVFSNNGKKTEIYQRHGASREKVKGALGAAPP